MTDELNHFVMDDTDESPEDCKNLPEIPKEVRAELELYFEQLKREEHPTNVGRKLEP